MKMSDRMKPWEDYRQTADYTRIANLVMKGQFHLAAQEAFMAGRDSCEKVAPSTEGDDGPCLMSLIVRVRERSESDHQIGGLEAKVVPVMRVYGFDSKFCKTTCDEQEEMPLELYGLSLSNVSLLKPGTCFEWVLREVKES